MRVDITLKHETVSGFTDKKQEAFLAAFAVTSNLGPVDMTSLELKGVQRAEKGGLVISIEMRSDVEHLPDVLKKLSQNGLDNSLASFVEERPGGIEIGNPQVTDYNEEDVSSGDGNSSSFGRIAELEAADWIIIMLAIGALLTYQKVQNTRALEALKSRRNRRHSNLPEGVKVGANTKVLDSRVQSAQDDSDDDEAYDSYLAGLRRAQEGTSEVRRRSATGV